MDEGIFALDRKGRVVYMNATAEELLGWRQRELRGRVMHQVIHDRQAHSSPHAIEECPLRAVLAQGTPVWVAHDVFSCKNGKLLPVAYSAGPIVTDHGIQGLVVVFNRHQTQHHGSHGEARWQLGPRALAHQLRVWRHATSAAPAGRRNGALLPAAERASNASPP
jgi:PAS domain S-box-containing protein